MKAPAKLLLDGISRFDGLSLRERLLLLATPLILFGVAWHHWLWTPLAVEQELLLNKISQQASEVSLLGSRVRGVVARSRKDPNSGLHQEIDQVKARLRQLEDQIRQAAESLIDPGQMARLLEDLLGNDQVLRLVRLEKLRTEPLFEPGEGAEGAKRSAEPMGNIYRHGFAVEFEGDYFSTLRYLQALETLPWGVFWDGVEYRVEEYPRARVRLLLHTLSLQPGWVGV